MLILTWANHFDNHLQTNIFIWFWNKKNDLPMQWITPLSFALSWEKLIWSIGEPCETSTSISSGVKWTPERMSASDNSGYWKTKNISGIISMRGSTYWKYVDAWSNINWIFSIWFHFKFLNSLLFWIRVSNSLFSCWRTLNTTGNTNSTKYFFTSYIIYFSGEVYFSGERISDVELSPIPIRRWRLIVCVNSLNVYPSNSPLILIVPVGRICGFPSIEIWTFDNGINLSLNEKLNRGRNWTIYKQFSLISLHDHEMKWFRFQMEFEQENLYGLLLLLFDRG
jgi:hypothetical protein